MRNNQLEQHTIADVGALTRKYFECRGKVLIEGLQYANKRAHDYLHVVHISHLDCFVVEWNEEEKLWNPVLYTDRTYTRGLTAFVHLEDAEEVCIELNERFNPTKGDSYLPTDLFEFQLKLQGNE